MRENGTGERTVLPTVDYRKGKVVILDQTLLPAEERVLGLATIEEVAEAIGLLRVRGAPAIGITASYGMLLALENLLGTRCPHPAGYRFDRTEEPGDIPADAVSPVEIASTLAGSREILARTRPTAVNLFYALDRMQAVLDGGGDPAESCRRLAREAFAIHEEELAIEIALGEIGAELLGDGMTILTHCNAGGLATAGYGTALGVVYAACEQGKRISVFADETRPLLQGARLTAWELSKRGIDATVLCDGAAASLLAVGRIDAVIVGADRIASNGDTANKVGTLSLAVLCRRFGVPFYVAAPWSTFDLTLGSGDGIPIEERDAAEVRSFGGRETVPKGVAIYNPAFDVTPAELITAIITERGIIEAPDAGSIGILARKTGLEPSGGASAGR